MFVQIITHTPVWVWGIFALLMWLGIKQSRPSAPGLSRITLIPLVMLSLSLYGAVSVFGGASSTLLAWGSSAVAVAAYIVQQPLQQGTHYNSWTKRFELPGSWLPGLLMIGIFMTKYAVGITAAMRPDVLHSTAFSYGICAVYGGFSGVFAGRALRLCRLVWRQTNGLANLKAAQ